MLPGYIGARTEALAGKPQGDSGSVLMALPGRVARLDAMAQVIDVAGLDGLIAALRQRGYTVVGPTVRDGAIVYEELESAAALPAGWTDVQDGGSYRLERRDDEARFGYAVGPTSWKQFLFPPRIRLWRATQRGDGLEVEEEPLDERPLAFFGVRPCELAAIAIQDRVFLGGRYADRDYAARREGLFLVAVNCHEPGGTCFCDLDGHRARPHRRATTSSSPSCSTAGTASSSRPAASRARSCSRSSAAPRRRTPTSAAAEQAEDGRRAGWAGSSTPTDIRDLLRANLEHPRWDEVAERCLTCGNCTLVCPTCFCSTVEDANDLTGEQPSARASGTRASRSTTRTSTAARSGSRRRRATASG